MKIAIIGSGISSLGAAYYLHKHHYDITVFEKNNYIGGHSRTFDIKKNEHQTISVDTGFIVFNKQNYPYLVKLFDETGVGYEKSDMSFSATIANGWLEYGTKNIPSMFAQKRNIFRKSYWQMVRDILHFFKNAEQFLEADDTLTLEECLHRMGYSEWFKTYFILAIGGAIWSCPVPIMLKFPAKTFIRFFKNHGLLSTTGQPQWYTVTGGSKNYVSKIINILRQ
jgi:predicted NAD/FAD-binding protein